MPGGFRPPPAVRLTRDQHYGLLRNTRSLLSLLQQSRGGSSSNVPQPIVPLKRTGTIPLSLANYIDPVINATPKKLALEEVEKVPLKKRFPKAYLTMPRKEVRLHIRGRPSAKKIPKNIQLVTSNY